MKPWKVAAIIERPIPFYVPHYRSLSERSDIDLDVIYLTDAGLKPFDYHGVRIEYTDEVLHGYNSIVLGRSRPGINKLFRTPRLGFDLWRTLSRNAYDAVWIHGYNLVGHWIAFIMCVALRLPIMLRGESELMFERSFAKRVLKKTAFSSLFPRIAAFLYIGTLNKQFYRFYGVPDSKLFPVPYGIDNSFFSGANEEERRSWRQEVRARLGISQDAVVFVNHSKHRLPKRPADVVRAFGRLEPAPDVALLLIGDGDQREEVDSACAALGEGHCVIRLGFQTHDELRRILVASDVLTFASEENWGMAVNEALAAGLAILCSDKVAGAVDMVEEGVNGYLFRSRDEEDLSRRMYEMIADRALVTNMGTASRVKAREFNFETMNNGIRSALSAISLR